MRFRAFHVHQNYVFTQVMREHLARKWHTLRIYKLANTGLCRPTVDEQWEAWTFNILKPISILTFKALYKGEDIPQAPPAYRNRDVNGMIKSFVNYTGARLQRVRLQQALGYNEQIFLYIKIFDSIVRRFGYNEYPHQTEHFRLHLFIRCKRDLL